MNAERFRKTGLMILIALAAVMFVRSALAFDGRVYADPALGLAHAPSGSASAALHASSPRLPGFEWLADRAPWTRVLLAPVLDPFALVYRESVGAFRLQAIGAHHHAAFAPPGVEAPPHVIDRILALPLRPVQIGEAKRIPLDPAPTAGIVVKLSF